MPKNKTIEDYAHEDKERTNNPPVGLVTPQTDPDTGGKKTWAYDPHLEPSLQWAGKTERAPFEVPTVSLHVHERIEARTIIEAVKKGNGNEEQMPLFASPEQNPPLRQAVEFYQHRHGWSNRLIAGDSLLVMNSLLEKEALAGKVQCVYMDPPYGIRYGSNFQPFVSSRPKQNDDSDNNLTLEPEMLRAFRDTWELGIHSYLSYLHNRLLLTRELLTDSGSCFVQIGDENVHRVAMMMDDVFGAENRLTTISFATTSGSSASKLPQVADYLLWYAKDKAKSKYRQLYEPLTRAEIIEHFNWDVMVELPDGQCRKLSVEERANPDKHLPKGARIYRRAGLDSQGVSTTGRSEPYEWNGRVFHCSKNRHWSISKEGMDRLGELGRLEALEGQTSLMWKKYEEEVPGRRISNVWPAQMYANPKEKKYVVETSTKVIQRCLLMTTDPGDLVFDPTCGSGATAYVAEQWGRRWITCDTSRIALTLAKQRLMTAVFDYYQLARPSEGVGSGFKYKSVATVSPSILAYDNSPAIETLYDQPLDDEKKARVSGPFTVEAVPAPMVKSIADISAELNAEPAPYDNSIVRSGETLRQEEWRDELQKAGIRGKNGQHIAFSRVESFPGRYLHADAETRPDDSGAEGVRDEAATAYAPQRAVICFGPEHAPLEQRYVENALEEAGTLRPKPKIIIFAAFQFDPEAAKDIDETNWPGVTLLKAQMNADLQTGDLRKQQRSNESFWLVGQPEVQLAEIPKGDHAGKWRVEVCGFDYFNTKTGELESGGKEKIALWMLDTDYDGRSLYPKQVFFPMSGAKDGWLKLAKTLKGEIDQDLIKGYHGTQSIPFDLGEHKRIAVKIVDDRGVESLRVISSPE